MEESNKETKLDISGRVEERDKITPNPEFRAKVILDLIKDHNNDVTNWDIICFCVEYLGSQLAVYDWLEEELIKRLTTRVYIAHYISDEIPDTGVV